MIRGHEPFFRPCESFQSSSRSKLQRASGTQNGKSFGDNILTLSEEGVESEIMLDSNSDDCRGRKSPRAMLGAGRLHHSLQSLRLADDCTWSGFSTPAYRSCSVSRRPLQEGVVAFAPVLPSRDATLLLHLWFKLEFSVALHPQRPYGLLGTGSPGWQPLLSHRS